MLAMIVRTRDDRSRRPFIQDQRMSSSQQEVSVHTYSHPKDICHRRNKSIDQSIPEFDAIEIHELKLQ
jgi:hypothetical protein